MEKCRRMKRPQFVKELDIFLTMKVLGHTLALLWLGKLCDEHGHSYEWINGQKPLLIKNGIRIQCNTENFVPIVVPGLSTSSSSSFPSSTSMTPSRQEIDHPTASSSSSTSPRTSPTVWSDDGIRAREDLCGIDSDPATVWSKYVKRKERGDLLTKPTKNPKQQVLSSCNEQHHEDACSSSTRQLGCVFQDMEPPKSLSILRKSSNTRKPIRCVKFTKAVARHAGIRDQNPSLGMICPGDLHQRNPNAPKFEDRSQEETEWQERCAREAAGRLAKNILKLKEKHKTAFFSPSENWCLPAPSTLGPEEREFVADSRASMHMISKTGLELCWNGCFDEVV